VLNMLAAQDEAGFGGCTNMGECTAVCPKGIPLTTISRLNRDFLHAAHVATTSRK
jgi:succinate dehydrogenase / fumarate reductase iron-sulfur subunit